MDPSDPAAYLQKLSATADGTFSTHFIGCVNRRVPFFKLSKKARSLFSTMVPLTNCLRAGQTNDNADHIRILC